jgi:hypothetical protein
MSPLVCVHVHVREAARSRGALLPGWQIEIERALLGAGSTVGCGLSDALGEFGPCVQRTFPSDDAHFGFASDVLADALAGAVHLSAHFVRASGREVLHLQEGSASVRENIVTRAAKDHRTRNDLYTDP